jgi:signal transduction histidine kinase
METGKKYNKQIDIGERRKGDNRRVLEDRRKAGDRRSGADRRTGWGKIESYLLRGTLAATASIVFQLSRPFTIILGYIDLLLNNTKEEQTKQKLTIMKEQLKIISEILDDFREIEEFKTKNFDGVDILATNKLLEEEKEEEPSKLDRKIL